ncbi:hypothetical protein [Priestia aryabhattai]
MEKQEWLDSLQVGDTVVEETTGFSRKNYQITTVRRITEKRRITTATGSKFNNFGREIGKDSSRRALLTPLTEKIIATLTRRENLSLISRTNFDSLPNEYVEKIATIIKEYDLSEKEKSNK